MSSIADSIRVARVLVAASIVCPLAFAPARGQSATAPSPWRWEGGGTLGYGSYDFVDRHGTVIGGGHFGWKLSGTTLFEVSMALITARSSTGQENYAVNSDLGLALDIDRLRLSPTAGFGAGYAFAGKDSPDGLALHALAGARYLFKPNWTFRLDAKFRSIDGGRAKTLEITFGLNKRR